MAWHHGAMMIRGGRLVTNGGAKSLTFLVLQGVGEYDFVPLLPG